MDFSEKEVFVRVDDSGKYLVFDYEVMQVALYHIIENAVKYIKPKTTLTVKFNEIEGEYHVCFEMESCYIGEHEKEKIFEEGYKGVYAKKCGEEGDGVGMFRVRQVLNLEEINIVVDNGNNYDEVYGTRFAKNKFILVFDLKKQK
jgi:signal transduction histidine kinase